MAWLGIFRSFGSGVYDEMQDSCDLWHSPIEFSNLKRRRIAHRGVLASPRLASVPFPALSSDDSA
jgi:hypothetical protein